MERKTDTPLALRHRLLLPFLLSAALVASCASRHPVLAPPPGGADAVEGYGHAAIEGEGGSLKGRFSFLFRRPGFGRLDALGPLNRIAYFLVIREDEAYLVIPSKKIYMEDSPDALLGRILGFPIRPCDVVSLMSGRWAGREDEKASGVAESWMLETNEKGRVIKGTRNGLTFEVREFFGRAGVPKSVRISNPPVSGLLRILSVRFNPPARPEAFATPFIKSYSRRSWEEILEIMKDEN